MQSCFHGTPGAAASRHVCVCSAPGAAASIHFSVRGSLGQQRLCIWCVPLGQQLLCIFDVWEAPGPAASMHFCMREAPLAAESNGDLSHYVTCVKTLRVIFEDVCALLIVAHLSRCFQAVFMCGCGGVPSSKQRGVVSCALLRFCTHGAAFSMIFCMCDVSGAPPSMHPACWEVSAAAACIHFARVL